MQVAHPPCGSRAPLALTCPQVDCYKGQQLPHHEAAQGLRRAQLLDATLQPLHVLSSRALPEHAAIRARHGSNEGTGRRQPWGEEKLEGAAPAPTFAALHHPGAGTHPAPLPTQFSLPVTNWN